MRYDRIKNLREDHDLKQSDIIRQLHCSQQAYSNYENGIREIPIELLIELAKIYSTSVDYILGLTDIKKPYPKTIKK